MLCDSPRSFLAVASPPQRWVRFVNFDGDTASSPVGSFRHFLLSRHQLRGFVSSFFCAEPAHRCNRHIRQKRGFVPSFFCADPARRARISRTFPKSVGSFRHFRPDAACRVPTARRFHKSVGSFPNFSAWLPRIGTNAKFAKTVGSFCIPSKGRCRPVRRVASVLQHCESHSVTGCRLQIRLGVAGSASRFARTILHPK